MMPTYSPNDIALIINYKGMSHVVGGYTESAMLTIAPNNQRFTMGTTADNRPFRIKHGDNSKSVTISLIQMSYSNDVLWQIHLDDIETNLGSFQLMFKDNAGRTVMSSNECYIVTPPATSVSNGSENREWQIYCHDPVEHIGGNDQVPPNEVAMLGTLGYTVEDRWKQ